MIKPAFSAEVRGFFRQSGRLGAQVHRITPEAARRGVEVRQAKADFKRRGYGSEVALMLARQSVLKHL
jgi:hypothetical protein